ncbi:MAG: CBS domain-containing protein, partial [Bdellovibrionales bacterium]|nr:CBS domain-containing protein [Bdellovibrionales bacterium]
IPVTDGGVLCGLVSEDSLLSAISSGVSLDTSLGEVMQRAVPTAVDATPISALQEILAKERCAIVIDADRKPLHIVTKIDLVDYLAQVVE